MEIWTFLEKYFLQTVGEDGAAGVYIPVTAGVTASYTCLTSQVNGPY